MNFLRNEWQIKVLLLTFFVAACIRAFKTPFVGWDSAVYIGIGKSIYSLSGIGAWEIMRPLGLPLILGAIWKSGFPVISFGKILAVTFALLNIFLVYRICRKIFNLPIALFSAFFLAITPLFFIHSTEILTEIPSTFFALLAFYFFATKQNLALTGVFAGLSVLFRLPQGIFLIALGLSILIFYIKKPKQIIRQGVILGLSFFLTILPFLIFNIFAYHAEEPIWKAALLPFILASTQQANPFYGAGEALLFGLFYFVNIFRQNWFMFFLIPGIFYFFWQVRYKQKANLALLSVFVIFILYFSLVPNKQLRFALVFLPFMAMLAAYGFYSLIRPFWTKKKALSAVIIVLLGFVYVLFLYNSGEYPFHPSPIDVELSPFFQYFAAHPSSGAIFTTVAFPIAYSDNKFIPMYYVNLEKYDKNKADVIGVIYASYALPCLQGDATCVNQKNDFYNQVQKDFPKKAFSKEFLGEEYSIFLR